MASRLLSRTEIGLRPWVCFPTNMRPEGLTLHYPGGSPWTTSRSVGGRGIDRSSPARFRDTCDHRFCAAIWRGFQAHHMDARGGCDIFYDGGTCPHGVRLSGRPRNMRSGAQGTNDGNYRSKGIQYIGGLASNGQLDPLTDEAKSAFHDWAADFRLPLRWGHRDWKSTACPGGDVYAWRTAGFPKVTGGPIPKTEDDELTPEESDYLRRIAHAVIPFYQKQLADAGKSDGRFQVQPLIRDVLKEDGTSSVIHKALADVLKFEAGSKEGPLHEIIRQVLAEEDAAPPS